MLQRREGTKDLGGLPEVKTAAVQQRFIAALCSASIEGMATMP